MARIIRGMDERGLRDTLYNRPVAAINYTRRLFEEGGLSSSFSEKFRERITKSYETVRDSRLWRSTLASTRKLRNLDRPNTVLQLLNIGQYQHASMAMRDAVMANPNFRKRYNRGMLAGYETTYSKSDTNRGRIEHTHDTYRTVMSGIAVERDMDDGEKRFVSSSYFLEKDEKDRYDAQDRGDIRISWAVGDELLLEGIDDPVSYFNAAI